MNGLHYIRKCEHGTLIEQCRCIDVEKTELRGPCPGNCPERNEDDASIIEEEYGGEA